MARFLVIGGAGGVGSAVVGALRKREHPVVASVLNENEKKAVARAAPDVRTFVLDLSVPEGVKSCVEAALGREGDELAGVAVCAAISPIGPVESTDLSVFRRSMDINYLSNVAIFQAVAPRLRDSGGRLVMISSMAGRVAMPFVGAYSGSKFALEGVADAMRREVGAHGVHVALVEPGGIKTPMVEAQLKQVADQITKLSDTEEKLYGHLYRGFQRAASASRETSASKPEQVAEVVVQALTESAPKARYVAGAEAEQMIAASKAMGDAEMDAMMAQFMAG